MPTLGCLVVLDSPKVELYGSIIIVDFLSIQHSSSINFHDTQVLKKKL